MTSSTTTQQPAVSVEPNPDLTPSVGVTAAQQPHVTVPDVFGVKDQWFLITGGSRGIGYATAQLLAQFGAKLVLVGRQAGTLAQAQADMRAAGATACHIVAQDLSDLAALDPLIAGLTMVDKFKGVFLNAGMPSDFTVGKFMTPDKLELMMRTNFHSPALLAAGLLRKRKLQAKGALLFMSSITTYTGTAGTLGYAAAKSGLNGISKVLAKECANQGIRVNALAAGMIETELSMGMDGFLKPEHYEADRRRYPLGYGHTSDAAKSALFLLSDLSQWMTSHTMVLDGGITGV
jgi:NAD(P)-dependent dehydrogenase (short-subunit alcohol dehydrogenase family)